MNPWLENPESADSYDTGAGAPYGRQPFVGEGRSGYGAQGQYAPHQPPAFGGMQHYPWLYPEQHPAMHPYSALQPVPSAPRKDPALMLVLSFFLPGLGTIVNGQGGKGVGIMLGYFLGALLSIILIGLPIMFGFWIWGMVDAYSGAKEHNARHGYY